MRGPSSPESTTSGSAAGGTVDPTPSPQPSGRVLKLKYVWDGHSQAKIVFTNIPFENSFVMVKSEDIEEALVNDGVNLRHASEISYLCKTEGGYVKLPSALALNDSTLELLLDKSKSKRAYIGPMFSLDPNIGWIWDALNPIVRFKYQALSKPNFRPYRALIYTYGLKIDVSFRVQVIFAFRPPFAKIHKHEPIALGRGIDLVSNVLHITYASFQETSGGVLMIGVPVGLAAGISYVARGVLFPLEEKEDKVFITSYPKLSPRLPSDEPPKTA